MEQTQFIPGEGELDLSDYIYDEPPVDDTQEYPEQEPNRKPVIIAVTCVVLVLLLVLGGGIWYFLNLTADDGLIYANVTAAGVDVGGMTVEEAAAAIHEATDGTYTETSMVVKLPDGELVLQPADTGAKLDAEALAQAAFNHGREGNRWENYQAKLAAQETEFTLYAPDCMELNTEFVRSVVDQAAASAQSNLTQSVVTVTGETPALDRTIAEANADTEVTHKKLTIVKGTPDRSLDADATYEAILAAYSANQFQVELVYNETLPDAVDLQAIADEHNVAPVDAVLDQENWSVSPEILGYGFDVEAAQTAFDEAPYGQEIVIDFAFIDAEVTLLSLEEYMYGDVLAQFSSNHTNIANRTNNLVLACKAIDGTILRPGETFSFNGVVGERTAAKGYKSATVYSGGKSVGELGGGICQVASTIYYCVLMADLEVVERGPHQFLVDYVPKGMDATVYWGSKDFKFKNNTDFPIRIEASTHDGKCHITLMGTDTKDYYVKMTYKTISGPSGGGTEYKEFSASNNPEGYRDGEVIQTAYSGYVIHSYKEKYNKETDELISSELEAKSTYQSRPRIVAKKVADTPAETKPPEGTKPPAETQPPATQPPATEPPATEPPATQPPATEPPATEEPAG